MMQRDRWFRYKLSSYQTHRLPPPSEDLPIATMERTPGLLECEHLNMHYVSEVRSIPSCAPFVVLQEWPMWWDMILSKWEKHVCRIYMRVCVCCATINVDFNQIVRGFERWTIHCHCNKPGSLQCKAGGVVLANWFKMMIYGSLYNLRFPWYREIVNCGMPKEVLFMGSVFVRGRHIIYIRLLYDGHAAIVLERMSFGWSFFSYGIMNNMVVLGCTYCKNLDELSVRCCARRTRRLLAKAVKVLGGFTVRSLLRSLVEPRRQGLLRGLMERYCPFTLADYNRGENPWRA